MVSDLMVVFDCLDGLQMRGSIRWQELHVLAESRKQAFSAQVGQAACPSGASTLPNMGKHVAPVGQILYSLTGS